MKTFKQYITEANRLWDFLYRKNKGVFYRGEKKSGRTGVGFGAMGNGIYITWDEGMAKFYAGHAGKGASVNKYKVKRGLNMADVMGKEVIDIKAAAGFGPTEYSNDKYFNNMLTYELKKLKFDGVVSSEVAAGIVIFDKKNVKVVK
tara:strand:+ start:5 stop:442 length:438 start_codon:yes stop_codon:yes gene_type:complete